MTENDKAQIRDLGDEVYLIDTYMADYDGITAAYLIRSERPCLIETGTARSAPAVIKALSYLGVGPHDLATIVVTHIHLDHAGGVGDIAAAFPDAEIVVHERGAKHLADPKRLLASAGQIYGPVLEEVFGLLRPTDAARIQAVDEVDVIDLGGGRTLTSYHSPGHAKHHLGLLDSATGDLYVGDAAGLYMPETGTMKPATPPPDFDLDSSLRSLGLFRQLAPARLLFSHFGPARHTSDALERAAEELRLWVDAVRLSRATTPELEHAVAAVRDRTRARYADLAAMPDVDAKFEALNSTETNVAGILRWLDKTKG
ncbi:MBL fold metallo-hydrolase [Saccharopolyspora spinosa]|uniref:Glyoxylase-like metal-dependent hydrolase (Beta-lactamase superfamily II) n=1 Tax=Saccharopolyspora spinosa TaxID=60894 RepID=A0A2N3Y0F4_SACSN|nr:MBL fold metallo-hydrolase [Saccharopolyspora spinosa]PKW16351.1 glyoxylase-like metal-dependent hydrolase (beta-lactamase superfamily II) [Saccharopolyspora spinosa]